MNTPHPAPIRLLTAKELSREFAARGVDHSENYFRHLIRACPHAERHSYITLEKAWSWWLSNPNWKPRARKSGPVASFV